MTSTNPQYYAFRPTKLKVSRLGVNISKQMNDNLNLASSQYMVVGEHYINQGGSTSNTYSLIVDEEGLAVNTSLVNRQINKDDYPVQLHGTVYIDGNVIVTGVISGSNSSNIIGGNSNFWKYAGNNNIYYDGKINIGNYNDAADNTYTLNISEPSNKDIHKAQIGIQNRQLGELRIAILGSASNSPTVFNTPDSSAIEFHVGRKKPYFDTLYFRSYSNDCGEWVENEPTEIPYYDNAAEAPHLNIDKDGNVGVHTSYNPKINYILRQSDPQYPEAIQFINTFEAMAMHVEGPMYARNMLIFDYETKQPKNLDELFVRVVGQSILACNINPGPFPQGVFQFRSNVRILTSNHTSYALHVGGDIKTDSNLYVDGHQYTGGKYHGEDIEIRNSGSFSNNIYVQNNIYFKANLYKEVFNVDTGSNEWALLQINNTSLSNVSVSNIYYLGDGIATSGRFGIGVGPTTDEVNHQTVIRKRSPSIFELEMMDRSTRRINKTAWIGHPQVGNDRYNDASLAFVTPSATDNNYNLFYNRAPQNIYFFPGYEQNISTFQVTQCNLPTLGVFENKKVGILTYEPSEALDVHGNIQLDGDIYYKRNGLLDPVKLGIWKARNYSFISGGNSNIYKGIEYLDTSAPHIGINTIAQSSYGLVVDGKLMSIQGYYTKENYQMMPWYSSTICKNAVLPPAQSLFTIGKVGIGMRVPETTLHMKANTGATQLRISQSEFSPSTILQMEGMLHNYMFHLNDVKNILELYYGSSNAIYTSGSNRPLIIKKGLQHQLIVNSNHDLLNNDSDALIVNGNVKVYGNVNVTGEYKINGAGISITNSQAEYIPSNNPNDIFIAGADVLINPNQSLQKSVFVGYNETYLNDYKSGLYYAPFNVLQRTDNPGYLAAKFTSVGETALIQLDSIKKNSVLNFGVTEFNDLSFFTNQNRSRPFFAFKKDDLGFYSVGFGTTSTMEGAQVHIYNDASIGCNMFRITKKTNVDSANAAPGITLEKKVASDSYAWKFIGPEESYQQKLQLFYQDPTKHREMFTFTKDGYLGIGNTQPEFAVDIATGDLGSIRMYQSDPSVAKPQLLFQSGSNQYGADFATDYRMYSFSNNFYLDMQDIYVGQKILFHFTSNSSLGIHQTADSRYNVAINGTLNVKEKLYLNGREIFSAGDAENETGTFLRGVNILLLPEVDNGGGVVINYNGFTSNLFYIGSGNDGNMMVLDSQYPEAQINFRVKDDTLEKRLYRLAASNQSFILEYSSNNIYGYEFDDKHIGFSRVVEWKPAEKNNFDMYLNANLRLDKSDDPNIYLQQTILGSSNQTVYILYEQGMGIGTKESRGVLHILNSNINKPTLYVQTSNEKDLLHMVDYETERIRINHYGNIGIGRTDPQAALDINGQIYMFNGTSNAPAYAFRTSPNTGIYLDDTNNMAITTNSETRMILQDNGFISINTSNTNAQLHINNSNNTVLRLETVTANMLECYNGQDIKLIIDSQGNIGIGTTIATNNLTVYGNTQMFGHLLPASNVAFDLGSSNLRWKDIYLSGNSIDLDNVRISKTATGDLITQLSSNNDLVGIIANKYQLYKDSQANISIVKDPSSYLPMFVAKDTGIEDSYVPIVLNKRLNAIGVGTEATRGYMHIYANSNTPKLYIQSDVGDALQVSGNDFLDLELDESFNYKKFNYQIDSQGVFNIGFGHTDYSGVKGLVNINENRNRHLMITNQKNSAYYQWIMQENGVIRTVFNGAGNLGIGTDNPISSLQIAGNAQIAYVSTEENPALTVDGTSVFTSNVFARQNVEIDHDIIIHGNTIQDSDRRIKFDIKPIESALGKIKQLSGYTFNKLNQQRRQTGLIAQEVYEVLPEAVFEKEDGILGIDYGNLMGLMVEGIKELSQQLDEIKKKLG